MIGCWKSTGLAAFCALACAMRTAAQPAPPASAVPAAAPPMLTLSTPVLRSSMERVNMAWLFPENMPDVRLKMERPEWGGLSPEELQGRLRGVEIRLPVEGFWVGYEKAIEEENPRGTLSIQRGF